MLAKKKNQPTDAASNEQKRAVHALNRLTFGPRPGDVQQVMAMGVDRWIDLQLHPEKISDKDVEARLEPLRTLRMSTKEILEDFPDRQMVKQVAEGKRPMPSDPARRAVYQARIARIDEKQERKENKSLAAAQPPAPAEPAAAEGAKTAEELAAAAAATEPTSPDANDTNEMNAGKDDMSPNDATEVRVGADASSALRSGATHASLREAATPRPTPAEEAEARRREDRLYADLTGPGTHRSPAQRALQESSRHVSRRAGRSCRLA